MSRTYSATNDKRQSRTKVNYRAYINSPSEPREHASAYMPPELEAELLEDYGSVKQQFRRRAHRMRNQYS